MPAAKSKKARSTSASRSKVTVMSNSSRFSSFTKTKALLFAAVFAVIGSLTIVWSYAATTTYSLWTSSAVPKVISSKDTQSTELGLKFKSKVTGQVQGVRFYKGAANTGTHTGSLWDKNGNLLATATFSNETASGWQSVNFGKPVTIAANVVYTVSYHAPNGRYSTNVDYFAYAPYVKNNLVAFEDGEKGPNGVYSHSNSTAFPTRGNSATNYWVDVIFSTSLINPTAKPAAPAGLQAQLVQENKAVGLSWQPSLSEKPIKQYNVFRAGQNIGTVNTGTTYTDSSVTPGTYTYQVQAIDDVNAASELSSPVTITVPVPPATSCPAGQIGTPPNCTTPTTPPPTTPPQNGTRWIPTPKMTWQWQLDTPVDTSVDAQVYDIDLFNNDASVVAKLHSQGKKVICYMETGFWEDYRPDAKDFPASVLGNPLDPPFQNERYLDIRKIDVLGPIMKARLDMCKQKGFDAIEPDGDASIFDGDNESNKTGFPSTYQDMIAYNKFIADEAHKRGLSIALKNGIVADGKFVKDMEPFVDFSLNEECAANGECAPLQPFVAANKAIFAAEYNNQTKCNQAAKTYPTYSFIFKKIELTSYRVVCQ